jgi:hypothetical protein
MGFENNIPTPIIKKPEEKELPLTPEENAHMDEEIRKAQEGAKSTMQEIASLGGEEAIQKLPLETQKGLLSKIKKVAAVIGVFATGAASAAFATFEAIIHNGDPAAMAVPVAIGAGLTLVSLAIGTTMLEKKK